MKKPYVEKPVGKDKKDPTTKNKTEHNKRAGIREIQRGKAEKRGDYSVDIKR